MERNAKTPFCVELKGSKFSNFPFLSNIHVGIPRLFLQGIFPSGKPAGDIEGKMKKGNLARSQIPFG